MKKIKIRLKELLKEKNLTQKELEDLTGIAQARISKLNKEDREEVNLIMLNKIINALEINDIKDLIEIIEE